MLRWATLLFLLLQVTSAALAAEWRVSRTSGPVSFSGPSGRVRVATGMTIPDGATLSTGSGGRVKLERGVESIVLGPNTVVTPKDGWFGTTTIEQPVGRIELEVEKRGYPHLTVETPLLAAVVKGTHFTVTVSRRAADVRVSRGVVGVTDLRTGSSVDITPGQRAGVRISDSSLHVSGRGRRPGIQSGLPRTPAIAPVTPQQAAAQAKASKAAETRGASRAAGSRDAAVGSAGRGNGPADRGGRGGPGGRGGEISDHGDRGGRGEGGRGSDHGGGRGSDGGRGGDDGRGRGGDGGGHGGGGHGGGHGGRR